MRGGEGREGRKRERRGREGGGREWRMRNGRSSTRKDNKNIIDDQWH